MKKNKQSNSYYTKKQNFIQEFEYVKKSGYELPIQEEKQENIQYQHKEEHQKPKPSFKEKLKQKFQQKHESYLKKKESEHQQEQNFQQKQQSYLNSNQNYQKKQEAQQFQSQQYQQGFQKQRQNNYQKKKVQQNQNNSQQKKQKDNLKQNKNFTKNQYKNFQEPQKYPNDQVNQLKGKNYNQQSNKQILSEQPKSIQIELSIFDQYKQLVEQDSKKQHLRNFPHQNITALMIAEKPSIARDIYSAISGQKMNDKKDSYHRFSGKWLQHSAFFTVTSVKGHVFQRDFPKEYQNWEKTNPLSLFDAETVKLSCDKGQTVRSLKKLAEGVDVVFLWLDNDREGENISFEILSAIFHKLKKREFRQIYRVVFSSLVKKDLQSAFMGAQIGPDLNQALAVEARQIFDLKVGVAFSRFLTLNLKREFAKFRDKKITYGPCQIPTLSLIFQRNKAIEAFVPEKYFALDFYLSIDGCDPVQASIKNHHNHFSTNQEAMEFYQKLTKKGTLKQVKVKKQRKMRPQGLNTVNLLKFATKHLGMSSTEAMHAAERLYLSGYMTYPRTESTQYPKQFEFGALIQAISTCQDPKLAQYARDLREHGHQVPPKGQDAGDHPPIAPTENVPQSLPFDQLKIYNFVVSNFIQSLSQDAQTEVTVYKCELGSYEFTLQSVRVVEQGYLRVKGKLMSDTNTFGKQRPAQGETVELVKATALEKWTNPPKQLTESELLSQMEKYSIGTDASMAVHINNVIAREYVVVQDTDRKLLPTDLGKTLVESLYQIDPEIVEPQLRGKVEKQMNEIARGSVDFYSSLISILQIFRDKFKYFVAHFENLVDNLKKYYESSEQVMKQGKNFGRCGLCRKFLSYADQLKKITCTSCQDWVYSFPDTVVHLSTQTCSKDNFPLMEVKLLLGLNENEAKEALGDPTPQRAQELSKKARGFGVFIKLCPFCAFHAQEKNQYYFADEKLNKKCDNCKKFTYLCTDKQKKYLYSICGDHTCQTLTILKDNFKQVEPTQNKCEKCESKTFSVLEMDGVRKEMCLVCHDSLKNEILGKHDQYTKFKRLNFKKRNQKKERDQNDGDNNHEREHKGRGRRRGKGRGKGRGRGRGIGRGKGK